MRDEKGADEKILAVPVSDPRSTWQDVDEVPQFLLLEIRHFFQIYKDLEPGKSTEVLGTADRAEAETVIEQSRARHKAAR
jgi:inorganic pyrophosphatase